MPRYIDADASYERAVGLEAKALEQLEKLNRTPFKEMTKEEYIEWRVWSAIYQERTAFKYDVFDARTADVVEVVRCKDCKHYVNDRLKKDYSEDKRFKRRVCVVSEYAKLRDPNWFCADGERRELGDDMSYDLRIAVKVVGAEKDNEYAVIAEPEFSSPTYNIGEMFRKCTGWDFEQGEYYCVADVYQNIVRGIINLTEHEAEYEKYNSPNGWGTTQSALRALKSLKECIDDIENPNGWSGNCSIFGWNTFPKSVLYVAW